jgi:hypothetical protein
MRNAASTLGLSKATAPTASSSDDRPTAPDTQLRRVGRNTNSSSRHVAVMRSDTRTIYCIPGFQEPPR